MSHVPSPTFLSVILRRACDIRVAFGFLPIIAALLSPAVISAAPPEAVPSVADVQVFTKDARILFQGDSITDGNRGRGADPNHILGHGYAFIIAAKYGAAFAERNLIFLNRGISGNKVTDLAGRWPKDTLELRPDVLSILIGVNDNSSNVAFDLFEQIYDKLLTDAKTLNPKIRLVLCEPFTLPAGRRKENWETWNAGIKQRQQIVAKLAAKHGAALVRFQKTFDDACQRAPAEYWIWDGVHPTYSGHQLMADEWVRTVREFWPAVGN
jgi:lysophospholipase L1-like esterase